MMCSRKFSSNHLYCIVRRTLTKCKLNRTRTSRDFYVNSFIEFYVFVYTRATLSLHEAVDNRLGKVEWGKHQMVWYRLN